MSWLAVRFGGCLGVFSVGRHDVTTLDDEKILRLSGKNTDGASGRVKVKNAKSPRLIQLPQWG